jgi:hypothetical protein
MIGFNLVARTALGTGLAVASVSAVLAGPWLTTNWLDSDLTRERCLEKAESAIRAAGFQLAQRTPQSRFGVTDGKQTNQHVERIMIIFELKIFRSTLREYIPHESRSLEKKSVGN